ncbi:MAG: nicotinate (nicotinamide) nucleotide adenylyltransferase [Bacteroidia bacterium]
MSTAKRVGLYFGSFNPVHVGHLIIANHIVQNHNLDEVWLVVTPLNPLKNKASLLPDYQRLQLIQLAIADNTKLKASDVEFKLPQPNYTITTLAHLTQKFPSTQFILILGQDNLQSFNKWKQYEHILANYKLLVYPRPHVPASEFDQHPNVQWIQNVPLMELSATFIRNAIKNKQDVSYLVPQPALNYINEMHFYAK